MLCDMLDQYVLMETAGWIDERDETVVARRRRRARQRRALRTMSPRRAVIRWEPASGRSTSMTGKGGRTRRQILDSAIETFGRRGFQRTTMHDIAATAGVASGTVYQYFSDKGDVLRCLLADLETKLFLQTRVPVGPSGRMAARDSVLRYLEIYREHASVYGAWWQLLQPPTEFTSAWAALHGSFQRAWVKALSRGQGRRADRRRRRHRGHRRPHRGGLRALRPLTDRHGLGRRGR